MLEVNIDHPAYAALKKAYSEDGEKAREMAEIMYDQAVLIAGMPLDDMLGYSDRVFRLFGQ